MGNLMGGDGHPVKKLRFGFNAVLAERNKSFRPTRFQVKSGVKTSMCDGVPQRSI